jgi:hypothetical protein
MNWFKFVIQQNQYTMPNDLLVNETQKLITIKSHGKVTPDEMGGTLKELQSIMQDKEICCVMVDTTKQDEMPSMSSLVFLIEEFPDDMKFALLLAEDQATEDDLKFLEDACAQKGKLLKCFKSENEADTWLQE